MAQLLKQSTNKLNEYIRDAFNNRKTILHDNVPCRIVAFGEPASKVDYGICYFKLAYPVDREVKIIEFDCDDVQSVENDSSRLQELIGRKLRDNGASQPA